MKTALSQELPNYNFTLINKSNTRVTKVILAPYGLIQIHTDTSLAPGERITVSRPGCKKMRMEVEHSQGSFSFPFTDFSNEKHTSLAMMVRKDSVPVLRFEERKRGDITGDNSNWRFHQIMGSVPFGVGTTTMAEAMALGAKSDKKKMSWKPHSCGETVPGILRLYLQEMHLKAVSSIWKWWPRAHPDGRLLPSMNR